MFTINEVKEHAKLTNYNLGQAEKDLYQNIILFILYKEYGQELVFKGGTALTKCYGLKRFSEDLDFSATKEIKNIQNIIKKGLNKFNIDYEIKLGKTNNLDNFRILLKGALYSGNPQSICSIQIDISYREEILYEVNIKEITTFVGKLPSFDLVVMNLTEIAAEKIRTIMTRNMARDLFDLYYIIDFLPNKEIINQKLEIYEIYFDINNFEKKVDNKKVIWDKELRNVLMRFPQFEEVKEKVMKIVKKKLKE